MDAAPSANNMNLPRLGLGMAALGRPGYINLDRSAVFGSGSRTMDQMQSHANAVMDQLIQLGSTDTMIPWLDCARSYGLSEKFVGEYLRTHEIDPRSVYVSSKWGYTYVANGNVTLPSGEPHEIKDHSKANFLKQIQETDQYLGEYVDLYQIHSATFESGVLTDAELHQALVDCRTRRGWKIGLSLSSPRQGDVLLEALKIRVDGERLFDSVQCTYNLLEQRPGPALLDAHRSGTDVIIKEALANGRLFKNPVVVQYASKLSCEPDQLALACILVQPFQPRVLSGAVTPEQLASNWRTLELVKVLEGQSSVVKEIMDACREDSEGYWKERAALVWN